MRVRFAGTARSSLTCQPAPSRTSAAWVPAGTARDSSARKTCMAAVETSGSTRATPSPRSGQTAPNRCAEAKPCCRTPRGRTPFWYQTWVTPPFWPTRASSMNQSSTRSPGCWRATPSIRRGKFFEPLLRLRVGPGVDRPRLLPGEVEPAQQPPDPALAVADLEAALDQGAQVAGAPGDATVALQLRAPQDQALQGRLPALVQGAGPAGPRPVAQALDPFRIVAVHPVAQGLPVHAGGPRRLLPAHPVQRVGQRQQARAHPPVPLAARQRAQLRGRPFLRDRHGDHGPGSRLATPARLAGQP